MYASKRDKSNDIIHRVLVWGVLGAVFGFALFLFGTRMVWGAVAVETCYDPMIGGATQNLAGENLDSISVVSGYPNGFINYVIFPTELDEIINSNTYLTIGSSATSSFPLSGGGVTAFSFSPSLHLFGGQNTYEFVLHNDNAVTSATGHFDNLCISSTTPVYTNNVVQQIGARFNNAGASAPVGFKFYTEFDLSSTTPTSTGQTFLLSPTDGQSLADFTNWQTSIFNFPHLGFACVQYDRFSSSSFSNEDCLPFNNQNNPIAIVTATIAKIQPLWFAPLSASGATWYAKAVLRDVNYSFISSSTVSTFIVSPAVSTTTQNLTNQGLTPRPSDCSIWNFGSCFSDFMQWLFIPSIDSAQQFSSISLSSRFPFSYYFSLKTVIGRSITSNSNNFPNITIHGAIFGTTTIFSAQKFIDLAGQSNFDLFYNLLKWGFWIFFGYFVFERFRQIL